MHLDEFQIVSSSPEILARLENGVITNRPLAGTRRRGHDHAEDLALEAELKADPKEIAEHLMLIDLGRNDVSRPRSRPGPGHRAICHRALFPCNAFIVQRKWHITGRQNCHGCVAGNFTGGHPIRRTKGQSHGDYRRAGTGCGIYSGAVGYLSWNGNMDTAIAIRTAVIKDGKLYIQAGGGIVHDSVPRLEWKESLNKGRAIFRAAALAENQLVDPSDEAR